MHLKLGQNVYYVYIASNRERTAFQVSTTGDLTERISRLEYEKNHYIKDKRKDQQLCSIILYWEQIVDVEKAMERVTEISSWSKKKKVRFIDAHNPGWKNLNEQVIMFGVPFNSFNI